MPDDVTLTLRLLDDDGHASTARVTRDGGVPVDAEGPAPVIPVDPTATTLRLAVTLDAGGPVTAPELRVVFPATVSTRGLDTAATTGPPGWSATLEPGRHQPFLRWRGAGLAAGEIVILRMAGLRGVGAARTGPRPWWVPTAATSRSTGTRPGSRWRCRSSSSCGSTC